MQYRSGIVAAVAMVAMVASAAQADVLNMPTGQTSLQFVTVGDPGNAADLTVDNDGTTDYGSVPYDYRMGKYDVTVGQYVQFLNAVAKTDTYGLYNRYMATGSLANNSLPTIGITQSGSSGSYSYSVAGSDPQAANCPIFDVTWGDAARFCNWLQNGQPTSAEGTGTTETGAYTLNGAVANDALLPIVRNTGATYFIPSEDEWYKAAYYKGGGTNAGYWTYPTRSNNAPTNVFSATGTNNANFYTTDPTNELTPVGAFASSPGPYGTFDMGGDIWQMNETIVNYGGILFRGMRGADFAVGPSIMAASYRAWDYVSVPSYAVGFRVASGLMPGDANGDGRVDINDLTIVLSNFGQTEMTWSQGDFTGDGTVDVNDLTILLSNFGQSFGSSAVGGVSAVPEPGALALVATGLAGLLVVLANLRRRMKQQRRPTARWCNE